MHTESPEEWSGLMVEMDEAPDHNNTHHKLKQRLVSGQVHCNWDWNEMFSWDVFFTYSHLRLGRRGFLMKFLLLHSSHKQQRPPSDLCNPRCHSLPHFETQKRNEIISEPIQILFLFTDKANASWDLTPFQHVYAFLTDIYLDRKL